jgi:NAD(P)H-dependent flavin oxidoreductase YrpB (nitropropane dioxygenase family)
MKLCVIVAAGIAIAVAGCTKQQAVAWANVGVDVAVDVCKEAPGLAGDASSPNVVTLLCPLIDDNSQLVKVAIDTAIWDAMKASRAAKQQ